MKNRRVEIKLCKFGGGREMFCEMQAEIRTLQNDVENLRAQIKNNLIT